MSNVVKEHAKAAEAAKSADRLATAQATLSGAQKALGPAAQARQSEIADLFDLVKAEARQHGAKQVDDLRTGQQLETVERAQTQGLTQSVLDSAGKQLEARQQRERAASADRPEAAKAELAARHQQQRDDLAALVERATKALENNASDMRNRQDDEVKRIAGAMRSANPDEALEDVADQQERERRQGGNTERRLLGAVRNEADSIVSRLTPEQTKQLREHLGPVAEQLDDGAIQRVAQAARGKDGEQQVNAIKGQLGEELNRKNVEAELRTKADTMNVFIAGDRLRDGLGRKLTDGVIARQREDKKWEIVKAFEVKSGQTESLFSEQRMDRSPEVGDAARDFARARLADEIRVDQQALAEQEREIALAELDKKRRELQGEDVVKYEIADRALVDALPKGERDERLNALAAQEEAELRAPATQTTAGQLERTQERLSTQRLFLDGEELDQDANQLRNRVEIAGVVASNAAAAGAAQRLQETQEELEESAEAVADVVDEWEKP